MGIQPKKLDDKHVRNIVSGLYEVVNNIMQLRNRKSAAHGKSEQQLKQCRLLPRHARLTLNAAHIVATYILETLG
ncbi:hypothetical protein ABID23_000638 [Bartonella silvatica]|uniref:Abortive infection protein-like C-terminal domain-containing protein n=1 Tax=Bartonella silvatica TaxID=357760 RepID=A0ABV2HGI1_9HYPH